MKKKKSIKILLSLNIVLLLIVIIFLTVIVTTKNNTQLTKAIQLSGEKMTDTSRITELEKQIDGLNNEHTTYGQYIQTSKAKIATAITNGGVSTAADANADTMATNIATLATNRYNQGSADAVYWVTGHPNDYGLYNQAQWDWVISTKYNEGYSAGVTAGKKEVESNIPGAIKVEGNTVYNLKPYAHYIIAYTGSYWESVPISGAVYINHTAVAAYGDKYFIMTHVITTSSTVTIANLQSGGGIGAYYICDDY